MALAQESPVDRIAAPELAKKRRPESLPYSSSSRPVENDMMLCMKSCISSRPGSTCNSSTRGLDRRASIADPDKGAGPHQTHRLIPNPSNALLG